MPATAEAVSVNVTVAGRQAGIVDPLPRRPGAADGEHYQLPSQPSTGRVTRFSVCRKDGALGVQALVGGMGQVHLIVDVGGYFEA